MCVLVFERESARPKESEREGGRERERERETWQQAHLILAHVTPAPYEL